MKKNIGLFGEIQEELRKSEEGRKRLFSDLLQREAEGKKQKPQSPGCGQKWSRQPYRRRRLR